MPRLGQLRYPARVITSVTLIALAVTAVGDDNTLPTVRVDGDATKTASKSYKVLLECDTGGQWCEGRSFFC